MKTGVKVHEIRTFVSNAIVQAEYDLTNLYSSIDHDDGSTMEDIDRAIVVETDIKRMKRFEISLNHTPTFWYLLSDTMQTMISSYSRGY